MAKGNYGILLVSGVSQPPNRVVGWNGYGREIDKGYLNWRRDKRIHQRKGDGKRGKDNRRLICESSRSNSLEGERHITFKPPWAADERASRPSCGCLHEEIPLLFFLAGNAAVCTC